MEIEYTIHYGGFVGAEEIYTVYVDEDATDEEIEKVIEDDYEIRIHEDCYWERRE